ncbi:MAG: hypothetical protein Kow0069_35440 [Promethearchaeota archaeon]
MEELSSLFAKYSVRLNKRGGQCFLSSNAVAQRIVASANLDPNRDVVLEVGTGLGFMTRLLAVQAKRVITYEVDDRLVELLEPIVRKIDNVELRHADVLKEPLPEFDKVVANLPFQISGPFLHALLGERGSFNCAVLLLQKEFAERLLELPGSPRYSRISAWTQFFADVEFLFGVHRNNFFPVPRVDAVAVRIRPRARGLGKAERARFFELLRGLFPYKRKRLRNALHHYRRDLSRREVDSMLEEFDAWIWKNGPAEALPRGREGDDEARAAECVVVNQTPAFFHALAEFVWLSSGGDG